MQDIAQSLGNSLSRDGYGGMRANLDMGGHKVVNVGEGTDDTDLATVGQVNSVGLPLGVILDYAGAEPPTGWLFCYGQAISRTTYASLYAIVGTVYGTGDGSTTFNLPDLRGRVSAGKDNMGGTSASRLSNLSANTLGASGGAQTHTLTTDQIPSHDHGGATSSAGEHAHSYGSSQRVQVGTDNGVAYDAQNVGTTFSTSTVAAHSHTLTAQGGGGSHPNVQPTLVLNKIIKAEAA